MRRHPRLATPTALGPGSAGESETRAAIAAHGGSRSIHRSFEFRAYKQPEVVDSLNRLFNFKCAYCETSYEASAPVDVEHYRPKGGVVINGLLTAPGYYWLAADWSNLLPSCIDCNRARTQKSPDADPRVSGKANLFPLASEETRATAPGQERRERRLLLHPLRDRPDRHLEFLEDGNVRPRRSGSGRESPKGKASIDVCGLRRDGLVRRRAGSARQLRAWLRVAQRAAQQLNTAPDERAEADLREALEQISSRVSRDADYSEMARQLAQPVLGELMP
jgi:uncharacterized protein (TIGR02646 family)